MKADGLKLFLLNKEYGLYFASKIAESFLSNGFKGVKNCLSYHNDEEHYYNDEVFGDIKDYLKRFEEFE